MAQKFMRLASQHSHGEGASQLELELGKALRLPGSLLWGVGLDVCGNPRAHTQMKKHY